MKKTVAVDLDGVLASGSFPSYSAEEIKRITAGLMRKFHRGTGYMFVRISSGHWVYEHRLVMSLAIGRVLTSSEVVHHKNGVRTDNEITNLELMGASEHTKRHGVITRFNDVVRMDRARHSKWRHDITVEILLESFSRLRSLRAMEVELDMTRKELSRRLSRYGYAVVRKRATVGRGWENVLRRIGDV